MPTGIYLRPAKLNMKRPVVVQPLDKPYRLIPLTQGKVAIVDAQDFKYLSRFNWCAHKVSKRKFAKFYAARQRELKHPNRFVLMHREIMRFPKSDVDHWDGNGLNNRRYNLRVATPSFNSANSKLPITNRSGFRGVCWNKQTKRWHAQCKVNQRENSLGHYKTKEAAACAYDIFALKNFGEFARTNLIFELRP